MGDRMRPLSFAGLIERCFDEPRARRTVFDLPVAHFWRPQAERRASMLSSSAANPVGPAAGPHTQLSQNIVCAWLAGGRYIELKTVQKLDALSVGKPCIDAADEGYNVEWSTELGLEESWKEYLKAWMAIHLLDAVLGAAPSAPMAPEARPSCMFNMSVGYDLDGIRTERMDRFIGRLMDCSREPFFAECREELERLCASPRLLEGTPWEDRRPSLAGLAGRIPARICSSVTLSTMHGCPPNEIESICGYLLREKRLDTLVKLNPTLLGHEAAADILQAHGFGYVALDPDGFRKDLQMADALPMLRRLKALGEETGRRFGVKLSNTLAAANERRVMPGAEMYLSGRALYPLTVTLAAGIAEELGGALPISFSGGVCAANAGALLDAGIRPLTAATELLKPGGYARLGELARIAERHADAWNLPAVDPRAVRRAAEAARTEPFTMKRFRGEGRAAARGTLPLLDCFVAPCVQACPIRQDVPEYVHLAGEGRCADALRLILERNPLPFMTGHLCDHQCMRACSRLDWEGAVRIREVKRIAADRGWAELGADGRARVRVGADRGLKAAVVGAGPAGLAAASFLRRDGFETHVFERERDAGGVVRRLLPGFRVPAEAVERDVALLADLGAVFHFGASSPRVQDLLARGFSCVLVGIGAEADRDIGIPGTLPALPFLRAFRADPRSITLGASVVVVGGGDTAMDAARAARRCAGVREVRVAYRRGERDMPASREEYEAALAEGIGFSFLRAPVRWDRGAGLVCAVMAPGDPDADGRRRPEATGATETIRADAVITAAGTGTANAAFESVGLGAARRAADPRTQETSVSGVYLIGDAAGEPSTIVEAIASARRAVQAVVAREEATGGRAARLPAAPPALDPEALRAARDGLLPAEPPGTPDPAAAATEARRCLGCRTLCMKCVEVCPNRANALVAVEGPFRDSCQVVHVDALCNECGNCATFCPWEGRPYRDKLTVFATEEDYLGSSNPGFFVSRGMGRIRVDGREGVLCADATGGVVADLGDQATLTLVQAVLRDHGYLLGGSR
jgi:putative selenate reductase